MKKSLFLCAVSLSLSACADLPFPTEGAVNEASTQQPEPRPATTVKKPPQNAVTVEQFDTTTKEDREAALVKVAASAEAELGRTIASLGDPTAPGFWLETPLVDKPTSGRVVYQPTGKSVAVDLIPIDGPATAGSRISLPAIRLLGAPLTGLPELIVYAG